MATFAGILFGILMILIIYSICTSRMRLFGLLLLILIIIALIFALLSKNDTTNNNNSNTYNISNESEINNI